MFQGEVPVAEEVRAAEVEQVEELHVDQVGGNLKNWNFANPGEEIQCSKCEKKEKSKSDMIISPFGIWPKSTLTLHTFHKVVFTHNLNKNNEKIIFPLKT